jgi:hypothetical protein
MNKIKEVYSQPTAELLVVRFEGGFLNDSYTPNGIQRGRTVTYDDWDGGWDDDDE